MHAKHSLGLNLNLEYICATYLDQVCVDVVQIASLQYNATVIVWIDIPVSVQGLIFTFLRLRACVGVRVTLPPDFLRNTTNDYQTTVVSWHSLQAAPLTWYTNAHALRLPMSLYSASTPLTVILSPFIVDLYHFKRVLH